MNDVIELDDIMWREIVRIARQRCKSNKSLENHIIGAMAEMAFEEFTGLPIDDMKRERGDGGRDFETDGKIIQIKGRQAKAGFSPDMLIGLHEGVADVYVLCICNTAVKEVTIVGWCDRDTVEQSPVNDCGQGLRYIVPQTAMREGWDWLRK